MKRFAILAALAAIAVPALAQVDAKVEKELRASYNRLVADIKKKDVKAVFSHMTPDATMTEMGRTMTRKEFEPVLAQQIKEMELQSSRLKFSKVTAKGDIATAEYTETMKGKMKNPQGKWSTMESVAKYKATFKKVKGDWKMKSSETVGTPDIKIDGKSYPGPGGGK